MKPPRSFRLDPKLLALADKQGLDLVKLFEKAIEKEVKVRVCPECGVTRKAK
jgi:hypothetical protein